ncbi:MAG TPA: ParB/RepB/Spo0J family partition protein [Steroidobacteraceae bacterium]|jgi:ParB family chromosome partitioning protein|nr:ParB/RepB/Spo0J family partition protein [Steroidobacteraceae bacterium]
MATRKAKRTAGGDADADKGKPGKRAKKSATRRTRGKLAPGTSARGLDAADVAIALDSPEVGEVAALVRNAGGAPIGAYRDPLGGRPLMLASLPLNAVQPTPFQRDLSPTHAKRLALKIDETAAFLDPLIVVRGEDGRLWTPNGRHRLAAAKVLGLKQITALISPDDKLAYRILALNTEKAHNLRDRSLEVIRMARSLAKRQATAKESQFTAEFESADLLTLGMVYEKASRFAGGAYSALLKKVDRFSERTLPVSLREREGFAARLLEIDTQVKKLIAALQARGFKSPYLRNYVVARINPVRFHKAKKGDTQPPMPLAQALTRMAASARTFKLDTVSNSDLAWVAVGAGAQSE